MLKARDQMAAVFANARKELRGFTDDSKATQREVDGLNSRITSLTRRLGNLRERFDETGASIQNFLSRKRDADDLIDKNITLFSEFSKAVRHSSQASREHAVSTANLTRATRDNRRTVDENARGWRRMWQEMRAAGSHASQLGDNVATLDNRLRGIGLLLAFAFAQQLIGAVVGLSGSLVALAGSAVQAGAALGGTFVAGMAQALPMVGLLTAAFQRAGAVMDAVNQVQKMQQQQFVQGQTAGRRLADTTDQIASAQDSLAAARDRVTEAEFRLNAARREARRDLQDLILAEREAELASRGAALSRSEAAESRRLAVMRGDTASLNRGELSVAESRLRQERALLDLQRQRDDTSRAVRGGVRGMPQMREARKQLEDALKAEEQAARGLRAATRNSQEAAEGTLTAAATLKYFLSQLTPAERRLYEALQDIQATYKESWRPITDTIIDSFTRTVNRVETVMKMPKVLRGVKSLSAEMSDSIDDFVDAILSDDMIDQLLRIMQAGEDNLEPLTDLFVNLAEAAANVAEFAGPALSDLIEYFNDLAESFESMTSNGEAVTGFFQTGEEHFEAWVDLAKEVVKLFFAISGPGGGAESGLDTLKDATREISDLRRKVIENAEDVRKFFADAQKATYAVISVLVTLTETIFHAFSADRIVHFANFLNKTVIPALGAVVETVGWVTDKIAWFLSQQGISSVAKIGIMVLLFAQLAASTVGAVTYFKRILGHLRDVGRITKALTSTPLKLMAERFGLIDKNGKSASATLSKFARAAGNMLSKIPGLGKIGDAIKKWGDAPLGGRPQLPPGKQTDFTVDSDGNVVPVGNRRGRDGGIVPAGGRRSRKRRTPPPPDPIDTTPDQPSRRSRVGRAGRIGAGVAGTVLGAAALSQANSTYEKLADVGGKLQLSLDSLSGTVGSLLTLDFSGFWNNLSRSEGELRDFADSAETDLANFSKSGNLDGIRDLSKKARDLAKDFPEAEEALGIFLERAGQAEKDVQHVNKVVDRLGRMAQDVRNLRLEAKDIIAPNAVQQFITNMNRMAQGGVDSIRDLRKQMSFNLTKINEGFAQGTASWQEAILLNLGQGIANIDQLWKDGKTTTERGLKEIRAITREQMKFMRDNIGNLSEDAKDKLVTNFRSARIAIETQTDGWKNATADALKEIRRLMRSELELYGLSPDQARRLARNRTTRGRTDVDQFGGNERRPATGGIAGRLGQRGRDLIPAAIGAGEMVLNHVHQKYIDPAVQWFYGHTLGKTFQRVRGVHAGIGRWAGDGMGFAGGYEGRTPSGNRTVPIPGFPGEFIARQVLDEAMSLIRRFNLFVTDAFATSGHRGAGHLQTGTAIDVVPRRAGRWEDVDAAVAAARAKGLTVLYDGVPGHGRGHHAHIELVKGALGAVASMVRKIRRIQLGGSDSPLRDIGQTAIDNVRDAANRMIRRAINASGVEGNEANAGRVTADESVVSAFRRAARRAGANSLEKLALFEAGIVESGLHNLPYGDRDSVGPLQQRPSQGWRNAMNPFLAAMDFLFRAIAMRPWRGTAGQLAQAVQRSAFPDRYDQVAGQAGRYFWAGGPVPGFGGGDVHPRWLEGGEHVWTKEEVQRAGGHGVMRMLRAMFGGGRQGGPSGFEDGGAVSPRERRIARLQRFALSDDAFRGTKVVLEDIAAIFGRTATLRKLTRAIRPFVGMIDKLTREGGFFDELRSSIDRRINKAQTRLFRDTFKVGAGGIVTKALDDQQIAQRELDNARDTRTSLISERSQISEALERVQRRQNRKGLNPTQRRLLQQQENELRRRLADSNQLVNENIEDIFNAQNVLTKAQEDIEEERKQMLREQIDSVNSRAARRLGRLDLFSRMLDATGVVGQVAATALGGEAFSRSGLFQQRTSALLTQRNDLRGLLAQAQQQNNTEAIDELTDAIAELDVSIQENIRASFIARVEEVNRAATFGLNINDLNRQIIELEGTISGNTNQAALLSGLEDRRLILDTQRMELDTLLLEAQRSNDQQAVNDLTISLKENKIALLQNTIAVNELKKQAGDMQGFSTTAWQLFRQAIFDGMGNLLPRYAVTVPSAHSGAVVMRGGLLNVAPAEIVSLPGQSTGANQDVDVEIHYHEVNEAPAGIETANRIKWELKTANTET